MAKNAPKADWSGHITMNHQQSNFFLEIEHKSQVINAKRQCGLLHQRPSRNPIRAEKTPRPDNRNFDYTPPPGAVPDSRWQYPETDWGLMAKFSSQKHIYDNIKQMKDTYDKKIAEFRQQQQQPDSQQQNSTEDIPRSSRSGTNSSRPLESSRLNESLTNRSSARNLLDVIPEGTARGTGRTTLAESSRSQHKTSRKALEDYKISTIKSLQDTNPEVLADWRAQRAAQFVNKIATNPLEVPKAKPLPMHSFKPPGPVSDAVFDRFDGATDKKHSKKDLVSLRTSSSAVEEVVSTSRMQESLNQLIGELEKTESEIKMQELKMSLNKKTKGYELDANARRNAMMK